MNLDIEIHPVKWLYYNLESEKRKASAIIASSYEVRESKITELKTRLILFFNDITDCKNPTSFNSSVAQKIHNYVDFLPDDTELLFICCDSGESRSSAIAAATLRYFGEDDMKIWKDPHYHPNTLVYTVLCHEYGIAVSEDEVREKADINERALSETIAAARRNS